MSGLEANKSDKTGDMQKIPGQERSLTHIHRVGTITCGLTFVIYGILFLLHTVLPQLNYTIIFRLWPVILILLGVEILVGTTRGSQEKKEFAYDFPAILLMIVMALFVMIMALIDYGLSTGHIIWQEGIYYGI